MKTTILSIRRLKTASIVWISTMLSLSCLKESAPVDTERIAFRTKGPIATKTTAVSSLDASGFRVSAVTGSAGSEVAAWTNIQFSKSGDYFVGDKYWPNDADPGYSFYAANAQLSYSAAGATVSASNTTDIVCAYSPSTAWKSRPELTFKHIFARVSTVTVAPMDGYDISDITVWLVNAKTGGTYNLRTGHGRTDGTGWSSLTPAGNADTQIFRYAGSITDGYSQTGSNNDLYIVPGEYYVKCSWTSEGDSYQMISNFPLSIVGGKVNTLACMLEGSVGVILSTLDGITWSHSTTFGAGLDGDVLSWPTPTEFGLSLSDNINWNDIIDLSLVDPLTGEPMSRETANCYVVTAPGDYCLPLFYGNAVVNGSDNISTAAPAKVNANDGVFVNAYDVAISSGNIKTDLENAGQTLNTSGGKLIWSTASATSNALLTVDSKIDVISGVGYLNFTVPSDRFAEGSALIGVLKSGSTTEYVWAWHIWITNGNVLETEEYTNYQSNRIDFLNRPLGGVSSNSLVNVYYQFGMPFPLPPSDGSTGTARLYDENGTYTFNYDSGNTITTLGKALSKPYLPRWNNGIYNDASGTAQNFYNMWDATQTGTSDKVVVKTIYDPSPAGMSVPRRNAYTGFTTTGDNITSGAPTSCNVFGSYSSGWKFKKKSTDETGSSWSASGYRTSGSAPSNVSWYGVYWSASPYGTTYGYRLFFVSSSVRTLYNGSKFIGCPVRPSLRNDSSGPIDLSMVNPLTGTSMSRETANCYVVTAPGEYCLPLFYGNAVVNGADNISTAAPAKVNANDGVFVNVYDVAISSGNIKTDLESAGQTLNTSGGKLIWSTASATSNALVIVKPTIAIKDGVGYLCFSVPSDRFQEGSALIGVLKDGSTTEYVWAWHIWITNGSVLSTEEYTNYQSDRIDFLNRPLGGRGGTSVVNTYYQFGMPFPLPPPSGANATSNAPLYDENGSYTFNYDSDNSITTLGKALSKPYLPRWNNGIHNDASGAAQNFYNMWDATQTGTSDKVVVKTIYDPSPAGMSVPRRNAYTGFTTTGANVTSGAPTSCNVVDSYSQGWKFKKNSSDVTGTLWAASGNRHQNTTPSSVGSYGYYWSACLNSANYDYYLYFTSAAVQPKNYNYRYYGYSVRPALL